MPSTILHNNLTPTMTINNVISYDEKPDVSSSVLSNAKSDCQNESNEKAQDLAIVLFQNYSR